MLRAANCLSRFAQSTGLSEQIFEGYFCLNSVVLHGPKCACVKAAISPVINGLRKKNLSQDKLWQIKIAQMHKKIDKQQYKNDSLAYQKQ